MKSNLVDFVKLSRQLANHIKSLTARCNKAEARLRAAAAREAKSKIKNKTSKRK